MHASRQVGCIGKIKRYLNGALELRQAEVGYVDRNTNMFMSKHAEEMQIFRIRRDDRIAMYLRGKVPSRRINQNRRLLVVVAPVDDGIELLVFGDGRVVEFPVRI